MKRVAKQRRFGPGEFAGLARQCIDVILKGQNILDFLASKGVSDPLNEWYDIRRWIKSNAPDLYAQIPISLRLELPVQRVNPNYKPPTEKATIPNKLGGTSTVKLYGEEKETEKAEETEMPAEETKRKPGRPARVKDEGEPVQEKKPRKAPQKARATVTINEVQGQKVTYTRENGNIRLHVPGFEEHLIMNPVELRTMMGELAEVLKILGR